MIEKLILGAMLCDNKGVPVGCSLLKEDNFTTAFNQDVFRSIKELFDKGLDVDIATVAEYGNFDWLDLAELTNHIASSAHIRTHCFFLKEQHVKRKLLEAGQQIIADQGDPLKQLSDVTSGLINLNSDLIQHKPKHISEIIFDKDEYIGIPTGFDNLDKHIGGLQRKCKIEIAGGPGQGKSAFVLNIINHVCVDRGIPTLFFTLEMSGEATKLRLQAIRTQIHFTRLTKDHIHRDEEEKLSNERYKIDQSPLFVDDFGSLTPIELKAKAIEMKHEHGLGLIVIDYLGLMSADISQGKNRENIVSEISRNNKMLAMQLDIPVIELCQLNRQGAGERPKLHHLRDSGCLSYETSLIYTKKGVQYNPSSRINVLSLNNKVIEEMNSKNIPRKPKDVFRLKLQSGRFIDCTINHPILTSDGYTQLKNIKLTDSIACAVNYPFNNFRIKEARFIGWMLGNGCMYGYNVPSFITADSIIADDFRLFIYSKFGFYPKDRPHYRSEVFQYDCTNSPTGHRTKEGNPVTRWLKENDLWGRKAKDKYIPEWFIEKANERSVRDLLQGLWETDGSIAIGKRQVISYSTTSPILANQILFLLSGLGIFSHLDDGFVSEKATTPCYKIIIGNYEFQKVFINKIKLRGEKKIKLQKIREKTNTSKYTNKLGRGTTEKLAKLCKPPTVLRIQLHDGRRMTKQHFNKLVEYYKSKNDNRLDKYQWLSSNCIVWDMIDSIKPIGKKDIFDRHVPKTNNFIVNGIIVHNSIEQDADVVLFPYRPGLGDAMPDLTTVELIIAKARNASPTMIEMVFTGETLTFNESEGKNVF